MQYEITKMRAKTVKGVGLQTDNSPENCAVFGKVWSEFMPIVGKISGRTNENCIGLYTDYVSDYRGKFFFLVGTEVKDTQAQEGFTLREIPDGTYAKYHVASMDEVSSVWQEVWKGNLKRKYTADFEEYQPDGSVDVYIAVDET